MSYPTQDSYIGNYPGGVKNQIVEKLKNIAEDLSSTADRLNSLGIMSVEKTDLLLRLQKVKEQYRSVNTEAKKCEKKIKEIHSVIKKELLNNKLKQYNRSKEKYKNEYQLIKDSLLDLE